ncbi:MAG: hypothetical protein H0V29_11130 [Thermoleophilaceae bacterium]|nr:hypothetical protein [Thermoleophilaceae bacterium]
MKRIALATSAELTAGVPDDLLLVEPLRARDIEPESVVWTDPGADWGSFDMVVIRSPWDYDRDPEGFLAWVDRTGAATELWNRPATVRWNLDKRYLQELDVPKIDTIWLERGAAARRPWERMVAKAAVDLGGRKAILDPTDEQITALAAASEVMLQPFMEDVLENGELSLMFIDGRFEHAARKTAAEGEFRIQEEWGGSVHPATATAEEIETGERVMAQVGETLYARVDLIAGRLIEVELVEPSLFLSAEPRTASKLAEAIERRL